MNNAQTNTQTKNVEKACDELESLVIRVISKEMVFSEITESIKEKIVYVHDDIIDFFEKSCSETISIQKEGEIRKHFYFAPSNDPQDEFGTMYMFSKKGNSQFWCFEWWDNYSQDEIIQKTLSNQTRYYKLE